MAKSRAAKICNALQGRGFNAFRHKTQFGIMVGIKPIKGSDFTIYTQVPESKEEDSECIRSIINRARNIQRDAYGN